MPSSKISASVKNLTSSYSQKKKAIKARLDEFRQLKNSGERRIFAELCFCILTPQSRAVTCEEAIGRLKASGLLFSGSRQKVRDKLKGVRFPNNKASYLVAAGKIPGIKNRLRGDVFDTRDWLVKNIKGLGYKEASHFLRNIGLGEDIAILDVHIMRNLLRYKVIKTPPKTLSRKSYLDIENKLRKFSQDINIPMEELDLLFWSNETGIIFK